MVQLFSRCSVTPSDLGASKTKDVLLYLLGGNKKKIHDVHIFMASQPTPLQRNPNPPPRNRALLRVYKVVPITPVSWLISPLNDNFSVWYAPKKHVPPYFASKSHQTSNVNQWFTKNFRYLKWRYSPDSPIFAVWIRLM